MSDKKWCIRFRRTASGRRCAKYGSASPKRRPAAAPNRKCKVWKKTRTGRRCGKYEED